MRLAADAAPVRANDSRPHHDGFLIYHPLDTALLDQLTEYLMTHGEKG